MTAVLEQPAARPRSYARLADIPFTAREVEILDLVADGLTNEQIGARLGLSPLTVKTHLARIAARFESGDRAQMVWTAYRERLLCRRPWGGGGAVPRLTVRQYEVLALAAQGLSIKEIGVRLGLTVHTVKTHLHALLGKLGARNQAHAVRLAVDADILRIAPLGPGADGPVLAPDRAAKFVELERARGKRLAADAGGGSRVHDYTRRGWGRDYVLDPGADPVSARVQGWGYGLRRGDFLVLPHSAGGVAVYRLEDVGYRLEPADVWVGRASFVPGSSELGRRVVGATSGPMSVAGWWSL